MSLIEIWLTKIVLNISIVAKAQIYMDRIAETPISVVNDISVQLKTIFAQCIF